MCLACAAGATSTAAIAAPLAFLGVVVLVIILICIRKAAKGPEGLNNLKGVGEDAMAATLEATGASDQDKKKYKRSKVGFLQKNAIKGKILISLIQVISQISKVFDIRFPFTFALATTWLNLLQLDMFSVVPVECLWNTANFHSILLIRTLLPLGIVLVLTLIARVLWASDSPKKVDFGNFLVNIVFFIIFLIYPSTSTNIFATFQCSSLDNGDRVLRADFSINCDTAAHQAYQAYAGVMLAIYPFGVPFLYAYLLFRKNGEALTKLTATDKKMTSIINEAKAACVYDGVSPMTLDKATLDKVSALEKEKAGQIAALPDYVQKLLSGYNTQVFYFESALSLRTLVPAALSWPSPMPVASHDPAFASFTRSHRLHSQVTCHLLPRVL